MQTIKGYYEDGKITLRGHTPVAGKAEVIITFLVPGPADRTQQGREPENVRGTEPLFSITDQLSNIIA